MDAKGEKKVATSKDSNSLIAEINEIMRGARDVEELSRPGGPGPTQFHQELARRNTAYAEFSQTQSEGQAFADAARAEGLRQQEFYRPKACRKPVTQVADSETDWAERMKRAGARMRK
jgi:hypothetical protein